MTPIAPLRAREGTTALATVAMTAAGLIVIVPVTVAIIAVDLAFWGLQMIGKQARRGTGRALVWLIGRGARG